MWVCVCFSVPVPSCSGATGIESWVSVRLKVLGQGQETEEGSHWSASLTSNTMCYITSIFPPISKL